MDAKTPETCLCDQAEALTQALQDLFYSPKPVHWVVPDELRSEWDRVFRVWEAHMKKHGRKEPQRG